MYDIFNIKYFKGFYKENRNKVNLESFGFGEKSERGMYKNIGVPGKEVPMLKLNTHSKNILKGYTLRNL